MPVERIRGGQGNGGGGAGRRPPVPFGRRGAAPARRVGRATTLSEEPAATPEDTTHVLVSGDGFVGRPLGGRKPRDLVEPTRVRLRLARVGPLSVLKLSLLFGVLAMAGLVAGLGVLYALLDASGVLGSIEKFVNTSGVARQFHFDGGWIFTRVGWVAGGMVVVGAIIAACLTVLYNSLADLTGGLDVTFVEHPKNVLRANETPTWITRFRGMRLARQERLEPDGDEPIPPDPTIH
jgi:hypothetical protein